MEREKRKLWGIQFVTYCWSQFSLASLGPCCCWRPVVQCGPYQTSDINSNVEWRMRKGVLTLRPRLKRASIDSWQITYLNCNPSHWDIVYIQTIYETQGTCTIPAFSIFSKHLLKQMIWYNTNFHLRIKRSLWSILYAFLLKYGLESKNRLRFRVIGSKWDLDK